MRLALLVPALIPAVLAGCSLFSSPSGPRPAELTRLQGAKEVRVLWSARVGGAGAFAFRPAAVGDAVYAAARDGTVRRLDAATGAERWSQATERKLSGGVGADGRTVAVATEEGEVIVLDAATGKLRWRARVSSEVLAPPAVGQGLVVVRSLDNRIFAFGEEDGKRRWVYQRVASSLIVRTPAGVTVSGDTAFAGFSGGKLVALALASGNVRWEATVALPKGATELERVTDVVGDPAVEGREVCAVAYQGRVACYEAESGRQIWGRELSSVTGVSLDARYAFVSDDRGSVHALDRSNGRSVWKQERLAYRQPSVPEGGAEAVAVGDFEGYVHFLARDTGAFIARYSTGGGPVRVPPARLGAGVLVQTQGGEIYVLRP